MKHITIVLAALVLVLGTHALTRAEEPKAAPPVVNWEFKIVAKPILEIHQNFASLQTLGADGWEAVGITPAPEAYGRDQEMQYLFLLKRAKR